MRKEILVALLLATTACGSENSTEENVAGNTAEEALNVASTALNEAEAEVANATEAVETAPRPTTDGGSEPVAAGAAPPPPPPAAPKAKAAPAPKAAPKAPATPKATPADPHAGHDMSNMAGHNMH